MIRYTNKEGTITVNVLSGGVRTFRLLEKLGLKSLEQIERDEKKAERIEKLKAWVHERKKQKEQEHKELFDSEKQVGDCVENPQEQVE